MTRGDATRVVVFPDFAGNMYLELMRRGPERDGFDFVGARRLQKLYGEAERLRPGDVLHLHWTNRIAQLAPDEEQAFAAVAEFTRFIERMQANGVRTVWTVHNRLPHESKFLEPELVLSRFLSEHVDVVHVMSAQTPAMVDDLYPLPADRVRLIPHPSYLGAYGTPPSRHDARDALGLGPDERTVLSFGRMRAYKGIDTLSGAITVLTERGLTAPTLLLAGHAEDEERQAIERTLPTSSRVVSNFGFVDEADVGTWFAAADVAVYPFRSILNSGSVHLAATLGVPVVLPGEPHLRDQFGEEPWVRFYDADDATASLADVLAEPDPADHAESMAAFSRRHAPEIISGQYADLLRELSAAGPTRPSRRRRRSRPGSPT